MKSVFKEIIIILLFLLNIFLILDIVFYQDMPNSRIVPEKVEEYALEETIKQELESNLNNTESDKIIRTYQLDSKAIAGYEKTNEYDKGKVNPFAEYSAGTTGNTTTDGGTTGKENNNGDSSNTEQDPSKDNFLNTSGK